MNTDTGKVYDTTEDIARAKARGEHVVPVSSRVAQLVKGARAQRLVDLDEMGTCCPHKLRHHFRGSRRPCKYRGCACRSWVAAR